MLINQKSGGLHLNYETTFRDGIAFINTSQWLLAHAAFSYLYDTSETKSSSLLYNWSLCNYFANNNEKASELATAALSSLTAPSVFKPAAIAVPNDLLNDEFENSHYLLALTETAISLNSNIIKLRIRRLLVDIYLKLENWQEIIRLSSFPEMDRCLNVQKALAIAKTKI